MIRLANRIVLTEACNRNCPHCFNKDVREAEYMDVDTLFKFWKKNKDYLCSEALKVMGGEPSLHPRFSDVVNKALDFFHTVSIFTNGSNLDKLVWSGRQIRYVINGYTFDLENYTHLDNLSLHFVVRTEKDIEKMVKCLFHVPSAGYIVSPNTQVNLMDDAEMEAYRKLWMDTITVFLPAAERMGCFAKLDHSFPLCFYTQEMGDKLAEINREAWHLSNITCCGEEVMGLIQANFDLYYCNQTRIKIGSILDEKGKPRAMKEIQEMLHKAPQIKLDGIKAEFPRCRNCPAVTTCKMGCFYNIGVKHAKKDC